MDQRDEMDLLNICVLRCLFPITDIFGRDFCHWSHRQGHCNHCYISSSDSSSHSQSKYWLLPFVFYKSHSSKTNPLLLRIFYCQQVLYSHLKHQQILQCRQWWTVSPATFFSSWAVVYELAQTPECNSSKPRNCPTTLDLHVNWDQLGLDLKRVVNTLWLRSQYFMM